MVYVVRVMDSKFQLIKEGVGIAFDKVADFIIEVLSTQLETQQSKENVRICVNSLMKANENISWGLGFAEVEILPVSTI